ncbi:MAG TPA: hypothetical protein VEX15_06615 [Nocardioidaceae bacterium]|nr:hypothetical protein [Nocardioidaceae bacterium]
MKVRTAAVLVGLALTAAGCGTTSTGDGEADVDTGADVDSGTDVDVEDLPTAIYEDFVVQATARQIFDMIKHAGGEAVSDQIDSRAPYPEGGAVFICRTPEQAERLADEVGPETGDYVWTADSNVMLSISKHLSEDEADRYLHAFENALSELRQ